MKRAPLVVLLLSPLLALAMLVQPPAPARAAEPESTPKAAGEGRPLQVTLATDPDAKPTTEFTTDTPKIYALWVGTAIEKGDRIRAVWIAEDVGDAAPKETKIDEVTLEAKRENDEGTFSLSKPTHGWPAGKYRVEFYVENTRVESLKFTLSTAK